tara:strand:- start:25597 stop:26514 length:918 start_codon:yes stop_codon:yes gene_type:complete
MIVVDPLLMAEAAFNDAASNVPENDNALYNIATAYTAGQKVMMTTNVHRNFECLIANTGEDPSTKPVNGSGDLYWLDLGSTNRWAMFDEVINNPTTNAASIVFEVTPGVVINTIGLLNIVAATAQIVGTEPVGGEFYNETFDLISTENVFDGYSYFFGDFITISDIVAEDIPPFSTGEFTVTISGAGTVSLGEFTYGAEFDLGVTLIGARPRIESFSTVTTNAFGNTSFVPRANRKLLTVDTAVDRYRINDITRKMADLIDKPALWVADKDNSSLIVYGILGDYAPEFGTEGSISFTNYEIKGLT